MPRLRPRHEKPAQPQIEMAICMEEFRPAAVAPLIRRGQQLPVDHWAVKAHPAFFRRLVPLPQPGEGHHG
jgi:hypothetical protein